MKLILIASLLALLGCSSSPKVPPGPPEPPWVSQPTRTVDTGYVVYVGRGQDVAAERAKFKAESAAMADLANECSFPPKGARVEDHFESEIGGIHYSFAKIGIIFEECEEAKRADDPQAIRKLANVAMTAQLKRYQDEFYVAEAEPLAGGNNELPQKPGDLPASALAPGPRVVLIQDTPSFFLVRQRVFYAKQNVILSPTTAYAPASPELHTFRSQVQEQTTELRRYETANPSLKAQPSTWSAIQSSPNVQGSGVPHIRSSSPPLPHIAQPHQFQGPSSKGTPAPRGSRKRRRHPY